MERLEGKYIVIEYQNKIICQGKIISTKLNNNKYDMLLVSIDNKYFFNLNNTDITYYIEINKIENNIDLSNIKIVKWKESIDNLNSIVYEENTIDELDKECIALVTAMNKIPHIFTTGSCCGHITREYYIDFHCNDFYILKSFLDLFNYMGKFKEDWIVSTDHHIYTTENDIVLELLCKHKGQKAYEAADCLAKYLNEHFKGVK